MRTRTNIFKRNDGRWEGRYIINRDEKGKAHYRSVYAKKYTECLQKLENANKPQSAKTSHITLNELFVLCMESKRSSLKPASYSNYQSLYINYISPFLGNANVNSLITDNIHSYIYKLSKQRNIRGDNLSPKTIQSTVILLKTVLKYGEKEFGILDHSKNIELPKVRQKDIKVFNRSEQETIYKEALNCDCRKLGILFCLLTGMRIGEICALQWKDIDIDNMIIHINKTLLRIKNPYSDKPKTVLITDSPKTESSIRTLPIPKLMKYTLLQLQITADPDDYFLSCKSNPIEPRTYQKIYKRFLSDANVEYKNFHVLRHTFATECIRHGVDVKTLSELMGHSNVRITLDRYVHSDIDVKRSQLEKFYSEIFF